MALRVISGSAGGIPLACPPSEKVRPTMEQVRGAVFSSLAASVPDARVLDLFAGAGSLGIEALSRGAAHVTFVERDRRAADCIRANLEKTRLNQAAQVHCADVFSYLSRLVSAPPFELIFADPPYTTDEQSIDFSAKLLASPELVTRLSVGGLFVLEKSPLRPLPPELGGWGIVRQKRYGTTEVLFLQRLSSHMDDESVVFKLCHLERSAESKAESANQVQESKIAAGKQAKPTESAT